MQSGHLHWLFVTFLIGGAAAAHQGWPEQSCHAHAAEFTRCSALSSQIEFSHLSLLTEIHLGKFHLLILSKNSLGENVFLLVLAFNPTLTK